MPPIPKTAKRPVEVEEPEWGSKQVWIKLIHRHNIMVQVQAMTYGPFWVHPTFEEGSKDWTVSSTSTGLIVAEFKDLDDAIKFTEELYKVAGDCFFAREPNQIRAKIPADVETWIRDCKASRTYREYKG